MTLSFINSKSEAGDVRTFVFEAGQPINWTAGQYIYYSLPHDNEDDRGHQRWFTISSPPSGGKITISTRIGADKSSSFKRALSALKPGDTIEAETPEGDFVLGDLDRNYIFIAGGIGITPYRAILLEADSQGLKPHVNLLYASRDHEIPFFDELEELRSRNPNLNVEYIIQPERIDTELLQERIATTDNPIVYVSGPEPMVQAFAKQLADMGLKEDNIKVDEFPGYEAD